MVAVLAPFHGGRHRPQAVDREASFADPLAQGLGGQAAQGDHGRLTRRFEAQQGEEAERRQSGGPPLLQQLAGQGIIASLGQQAQVRVVGMQGLHQHLARVGGATGAARHLFQQLGAVLQRPEVAGIEASVGIDHHHQGDVWQMVALGQHLGPNQQAGLAAAHLGQHLLEGVAAPSAVTVDAVHRHLGKQRRQGLLNALGAAAQGAQVDASAVGAGVGEGTAPVAVVAGQQRRLPVQGHARIAVVALGHPAAGMAGQGGGEAAPVDEDQHLVAGGQGLAHRLDHRRDQAALATPAAQVDEFEAGRGMATRPAGQAQVSIVAVQRALQRFQ